MSLQLKQIVDQKKEKIDPNQSPIESNKIEQNDEVYSTQVSIPHDPPDVWRDRWINVVGLCFVIVMKILVSHQKYVSRNIPEAMLQRQSNLT